MGNIPSQVHLNFAPRYHGRRILLKISPGIARREIYKTTYRYVSERNVRDVESIRENSKQSAGRFETSIARRK